MILFSELLDRLVLTPSRNGKVRLLTEYFGSAPDPDRGFALAAITGDLSFSSVKPAMLRTLIADRMDPVLFGYSYDYVGDLAETISLVWPGSELTGTDTPRLPEIVARFTAATRSDAPALISGLLDRLDPSGRFALIKLVTGGLRIGVSGRLARQALAEYGHVEATEIEELWHGLEVPYPGLFSWLERRTPKPVPAGKALFRPVMLAHPASDDAIGRLDPAAFAAEWKWDGIRVQAVAENGRRRLFSRSGDDISTAFPDIVAAMEFDGVIDGELLVGEVGGETGTFGALQQRLNRKSVSDRLARRFPAFVRAYDLLSREGTDLRPLAFEQRRRALEGFVAGIGDRFDLSPLVEFSEWSELDALRRGPPHPVIEGVMIKRLDSAYIAGRPKGPWFKWKRDPFTVDAVLMYAQRGHGRRSSFYSDFTFGVWSDGSGGTELVPVGKAYFGFTDEELRQIDKFVRDNTVERFGPVRAVRAEPDHGLVLEIAFEGLNRSRRHKSGVAMRFPRIARLRWDKPPREADRIGTLAALLPAEEPAIR